MTRQKEIKSLENIKSIEKKKEEEKKSSSGEYSPKHTGKKLYTKSLKPTDEQLEQLHLRNGVNDITFTVISSIQGVQKIKGRIYLWDYSVKIIISDVDGTITKSDMLGHVLPRLGQDWSHRGIAKLYTAIKKNGYDFIYLTSRPIG